MSRSWPSSAVSWTSVRSLSAWTVSLSLLWGSPPLRTRKNPGESSDTDSPQRRGVAGEDVLAERRPSRCRRPRWACPVKHTSTTSGARPTTSKICAPRYESTVQMPIFDRILSTPASTAAWKRPWASGLVRSPSSAVSASPATVASARRRADGVGAVAEQRGEGVDVERVVGDDHDRGWRERRRRSVSAWWTAPAASSEGTGARSAPAADVVEHEDAGAALDRGDASATRRSTAARRPAGPSAAGNVASSGMTGHGAWSVSSSVSTPDGYRKNESSVSSSAASADSVSSGCAGAEQRAQAHDQPLAQRVDRRVGDLGEALAQVVADRARPRRQVGQRRVVAHREGGLVRVVGHGLEHHGQVLLGVGRAWPGGARGRRGPAGPARPRPTLVEAVGRPAGVGRGGGDALLAGGVVEEAPGRVDEQHLARAEPASAHLAVPADVDGARPRSTRRRSRPRRAGSAAGAGRCGRARAPTPMPSVNTMPAGPSHGSISAEW